MAALVCLAAGCTATPESFWKAATRVDCRALKKCDEDLWNEAGFDDVGDCVDKVLDDYDEDDFASDCEDYDKEFARKCLRSGRKYKRSCDDADLDEDACARVCDSSAFRDAQSPAELAGAGLEQGEVEDDTLLEDEDLDALLQAEIDAVYDEED